MRKLDHKTAIEIWNMLVRTCGVVDGQSAKMSFVMSYADPDPTVAPNGAPREYRNLPRFGFAGKFWWNNDRFYVSGHSYGDVNTGGITEKDYLAEAPIIDEINAELAGVYAKYLVRRDLHRMWSVVPSFEASDHSEADQLRILYDLTIKMGLHRAADWLVANANIGR